MTAYARLAFFITAMLSAILASASGATAQVPISDDMEAPPTTLPFRPTVPSAPPSQPSYPQRTEAPPPGDPLCLEVGRIIRAGVVASRFATLTTPTAQGSILGSFEANDALQSIGADYCTVVIPAAAETTASSAYNQVTCQIEINNGETAYLDDIREQRSALGERLAECPAMARWTSEIPQIADLSASATEENLVFSHPDVAVEILLRATHRKRTGDWPVDYMRTLSLVFRTPNPDRPEPKPDADATDSALP